MHIAKKKIPQQLIFLSDIYIYIYFEEHRFKLSFKSMQ
jgi:hypothetical protein